MKGKLNILWQWKFIAIVLPLLAALFFRLIAAVSIRTSYNEAGLLQEESAMNLAIQNVRVLLDRETISNLFTSGETVSIDSSFLMTQLKMD